MSTYSRANTTAQWYQDNYPGSVMHPNVVVLHTTEGGSWPGYSGGAVAPNYTAMPDHQNKRLVWRAHFPDERSSRALVNKAGGVETNTLNCVQVELVGSCARKDGYGAIYWPDAPDWALDDLADFLADQHRRHGLKLQGPKVWLAYGPDPRRPGVTPASYGASPARMSNSEWLNFYGICGHSHIPENVHGDPGALPFAKLLDMTKAKVAPAPAPAPAPVPPTPNPAPGKPTPTPTPTNNNGDDMSWTDQITDWAPISNRPGTMTAEKALNQARGYAEDSFRQAQGARNTALRIEKALRVLAAGLGPTVEKAVADALAADEANQK